MNMPLLIPCIAVFVLSPVLAPDLEIGIAGMVNAQAAPQERAPQADLSGVSDATGLCMLDSFERFDGAGEVEDHDAIAKAKAKAERKRRADTDERFGMLMLFLHILQDPK